MGRRYLLQRKQHLNERMFEYNSKICYNHLKEGIFGVVFLWKE